MAQPLTFVHAATVFFMATKAAAEFCEYVEIRARMEQRVHQLMHGQQAAVAVGAVNIDIVAFKLCTCGQHQIREAAGGVPRKIDGNRSLQLAISLLHAVSILMAMPWVTTTEDHHTNFGVGDFAAVVFDFLSRRQNAVNPTRNRNGVACTFVIRAWVFGLFTRINVARKGSWRTGTRGRYSD